MPDRNRDERIREILGTPCTIAVVGMSPRKDRPSNEATLYLRDRGFTIIPVHPAAEEIEGMKAYPNLEAIPKEAGVTIVKDEPKAPVSETIPDPEGAGDPETPTSDLPTKQ